MKTKTLAVTLAALIASTATASADNYATCTDLKGEVEARLAACSSVIGKSKQMSDKRINALANRGFIYRGKRLHTEAGADFQAILKSRPESAAAIYGLALIHHDRREDSLALPLLDKALRVTPGHTYAYDARGTLHLRGGRLDAALADFDAAIRLKPTEPKLANSYTGRAMVYRSRGLVSLAMTDLNIATKLNPSFVLAYEVRGFMYLDQNNQAAAQSDFDMALSIDPRSANALGGRGAISVQRKNYDAAMTDLDSAISLGVKRALVFNQRGVVYFWRRDYERAIADYDSALRMEPNRPVFIANRAQAYILLGQPERVSAELASLTAQHPRYARGFFVRGLMNEKLGNVQAAIADMEQARTLANGDLLSAVATAIDRLRGRQGGRATTAGQDNGTPSLEARPSIGTQERDSTTRRN